MKREVRKLEISGWYFLDYTPQNFYSFSSLSLSHCGSLKWRDSPGEDPVAGRKVIIFAFKIFAKATILKKNDNCNDDFKQQSNSDYFYNEEKHELKS